MTIDRSLASVRELALEAAKSAVNDRGYNNFTRGRPPSFLRRDRWTAARETATASSGSLTSAQSRLLRA